MSLRIWLPMTKDLRNQGLDDVTVTNNGATYSSTDGKLGGCYSFGNGSASSNGLFLNSNLVDLMQEEYSVAVWVKPLGNHYHYNGTIFSSGNWNSTCYAFGLSQDNSQVDILCKGYNTYLTCAVPINTWTHLVCTCDSTNTVRLYKNGEYIGSSTRSNKPDSDNATQAAIGRETYASGYFTFNGQLNDFRLYDHCLSPMEVKELAKGLVLHYPLDRQGWGQDNVLFNTHFDSRYSQTTGWNTTKNGTLLANSWGGYNSGVTNQGTVYHAHLKEFNGEYVYEYIKTADESWLGISQGGLQSKLTAGKTYTFSWEEYHVSGANRVGTGLYYYKAGASSANFHLGIQQRGDVSITGKWQKCSYIFTAPSDMDTSKNASWYVYGHYNGNGTFYVRHLKLEEGSTATPWCPNSSDTLATTMGLNSTTEYDCSGFCNNGTRTGTFSWTSDTPKYSVSTTATGGASTYLVGPILPAEAKTAALWIKCAKSQNAAIFNDKTSGLQIGLLNSLLYMNSLAATAGFTTTHWKDNEWNHVVVVKDNDSRKVYINGQAETQSGANNYYIHNADNCWLWNRSYNNSYPFNGSLSDLRVYATALSADDVKSLYQNSAYIDSSGNVYGAVHSEV